MFFSPVHVPKQNHVRNSSCWKCSEAGDHPNLKKKALRVKRTFSELWASSGVFSEQLSEFRRKSPRTEKSHSRNGVSRFEQCENQEPLDAPSS